MSKKSFFIGTFILAGAGIISRFIGFFYRIFLSHTLGAAGLGIFQLSVPVQTLLIAISVGGIQTAISRLSASAIALKNKESAKDYFLIGTFLSCISSITLSLLLYHHAAFVAGQLLKEPRTLSLIQVLAFNLPLCTLHICINSYYYAQKKTVIPSMIQLLEQIVRVLATYLLCLHLLSNNHPVTPLVVGIGSLISDCAAVIAGSIALKFNFHKLQCKLFPITAVSEKLKAICSLAFPLTLNRILLTLLGSIEIVLIPQQLISSGINTTQALSIYGILSGMVLPLILFPSTLTNSASVMLMPSVTELSTLGNTGRLRYVTLCAYKYVFTLGSIFTFIFYFFGNFIGNLLFHNPAAGIYIRTLAFVCPFLYLNSTLSSILHGLGKAGTCLLHNSISICIRIFSVIYLIPIVGIQGYLFGIIFSEFFKTSLYSLSLYRIITTH